MALVESTSPSIPISQLHIPTGERHPYGPHGSHPNPHPFAGVHCPVSPKELLYSVGISSDISGFLGESVLLRVNACLSVCLSACLSSLFPPCSLPPHYLQRFRCRIHNTRSWVTWTPLVPLKSWGDWIGFGPLGRAAFFQRWATPLCRFSSVAAAARRKGG